MNDPQSPKDLWERKPQAQPAAAVPSPYIACSCGAELQMVSRDPSLRYPAKLTRGASVFFVCFNDRSQGGRLAASHWIEDLMAQIAPFDPYSSSIGLLHFSSLDPKRVLPFLPKRTITASYQMGNGLERLPCNGSVGKMKGSISSCRLVIVTAAVLLQIMSCVSATSRSYLPSAPAPALQPGLRTNQFRLSPLAAMPSMSQEDAEDFKEKVNKIGSSPPICDGKCYGCSPCEPIQVPTITSRVGLQYANYEPEGWKCKCGPSFYSP
ncbi:hypothetical protein QQ045_027825 [Rhodiola kirilowii]